MSLCLSVFPHDISKSDAARITRLATEMLHYSPGNPFIFDLKGKTSRSRGTKTLPAWVSALVWELASSSLGCFRWLLIRKLQLLTCCRSSLPADVRLWFRRARHSLHVSRGLGRLHVQSDQQIRLGRQPGPTPMSRYVYRLSRFHSPAAVEC